MTDETPLLAPGDAVERYRVLGPLGVGATAQVFRVRHEVLGTEHALKVLQVEGASQLDRALQEARVQARLRHPHVVAVSDVLRWQERPCLVMELVDGPSLEGRLADQGPLPWAQALALLRPVVDAVAAAHAQGVLHRDLKPANVLIAPGPPAMAKVGDFGLAKVFAAGDPAARQGRTRRQVAMGTPGYMAPEQWADAAGAGPAADVFGLCALLYAAIAGHAPFPLDPVASLPATVGGRFAPLDADGRCPAALARVIGQGLQPEPAARWASVAALGQALDALLLASAAAPPGAAGPTPLSSPTLLPEPASTPELPASNARTSLPWAFVAAATALVAGAAALAWWATRPGAAAVSVDAPPAEVAIPAMTFWRGDTTGLGAADERPVVQVQLPAFHIDRSEVSTGQYQACVAKGACTPPAWTEDATGYDGLTGEDQPVVGVTWSQAGAYCAWRGARLPTEVEWEAAATWSAQAARPEDKRPWPWGEGVPTCERARFAGCGEGTLPVDSLPQSASAFGPLHLAGNAWEWTASTYPLRRTLFRRQITHYVLRGGAWDSQPESLRPTFRRHTAGRDARPNTGFRCAR